MCSAATRAWPRSASPRSAQAHDQLGVAGHGDIRAVSREDELLALLFLAHARHDTLCNEAVVEVVLRLVNDEWRGGLEE